MILSIPYIIFSVGVINSPPELVKPQLNYFNRNFVIILSNNSVGER